MSKIKEIKIENFQSHEKTVIPFSDGFNVFVGASDQGKSAIIRALRWVLFNEPRGSDFIRAGSSICRVKVTLEDDTTITRQRSAGTNRYILKKKGKKEEIFEGFGNSVPQEIITAHGIRKIDFDGETDTILNLGGQLQPPFLLDASGALKAKALGRINGVHFIDAAQRDTVRDLIKLQSREQELRRRQEDIKDALKQYDDLPDMEKTLKLATAKMQSIKESKERIEKLQRLNEKYINLEKELGSINAILELTSHIDQAQNKLQKTETNLLKYSRLNRYKNRLSQVELALTEVEKVLQGTKEIDSAENCLASAEALLDKKIKLSKVKERYDTVNGLLKNTNVILAKTKGVRTASEKLLTLQNSLEKYYLLKRKFKSLQKIEDSYRKLEPVLKVAPRLEKAGEILEDLNRMNSRLVILKNIYSKYAKVNESLTKAEEFYKNHEKQYEELLREYAKTLKSLGRCPVCFNTLEKSQVEDIVRQLKL